MRRFGFARNQKRLVFFSEIRGDSHHEKVSLIHWSSWLYHTVSNIQSLHEVYTWIFQICRISALLGRCFFPVKRHQFYTKGRSSLKKKTAFSLQPQRKKKGESQEFRMIHNEISYQKKTHLYTWRPSSLIGAKCNASAFLVWKNTIFVSGFFLGTQTGRFW